MSRSCFRRLAAFVLILALAAPWAVAGEPRLRSLPRAAAEPAAAGFFTTLWGLMTALWSDAGCHLDPFGRCLDDLGGTASGQADNGCRADPFGRCLDLGGTASGQAENGCSADPFGRCGSGS